MIGDPAEGPVSRPSVHGEQGDDTTDGTDRRASGASDTQHERRTAHRELLTDTRSQSTAAANGRTSPPRPTSTGRCVYANRSSSSLTPARHDAASSVHSTVSHAGVTMSGAPDASADMHDLPFAESVSVCCGAPGYANAWRRTCTRSGAA